ALRGTRILQGRVALPALERLDRGAVTSNVEARQGLVSLAEVVDQGDASTASEERTQLGELQARFWVKHEHGVGRFEPTPIQLGAQYDASRAKLFPGQLQ